MRAASLSSPRLAAVCASALFAFAACDRTNTAQPPEVFENASASIAEAEIRALLAAGGGAQLIFPVKKRVDGALELKLRAKLIDVSKDVENTLAEAETTAEQTAELAMHVVEVAGLPADLERPKTGAIAIEWSVDLPEGRLYGTKSLYAALGKLEIQLRGATEIPAGASVPFRVIVRNPDTLQPEPNASVRATLEDPPQTLFEATTDAAGELVQELALPPEVESGTLRIEVRAGDTTAWAHTRLTSVHPRKIALSTDKTIYKPGQNVELRALALDRAKRPIAGEELTFEALDGKGNKVFKRQVTTDAFGVASIAVPTDSRVNEGTWTFRAQIEGAKAETKLPVEKYNLPKLKVTVTPEREYATPGETLRGRVEARYLFGLPVVNATVEVRALADDQTYANVQLTTDAEGRASYQLTLPQISNTAIDDGEVSMVLDAAVTDTAGQIERGQSTLPLARAPLVIKAIAEAGALVSGVENVVYLLVGDPSGRPLVATLSIDGLGPLEPLTTDANGVAALRFTPAENTAEIHFDVHATDGANRTHTRSVSLAKSERGTILLRTDKAIYRAGETAAIEVYTNAAANRVYLDVYRGGEGLETRSLDLTNGSAELMLPIGDAMKGVVLLDAFALGGSGAVVRGSQRLLVDPQDRLEISLHADREHYAPGEAANVEVEVHDAQGAPQVAALGLTGVDEAVFALGGDPDDNLRKIFNLDARNIPTDVRVFGRNADALFATGDLSGEEQFARILFASAKNAAFPGLDYNSIREELPIVKSALEKRARREVVAFLKRLSTTVQPLAREGRFTRVEAEQLVLTPLRGLADVFGRTYRADFDTDSWQNLVVRSAGPDELHDTADDVSIALWYGWIQWAGAADTVDENGVVRGGFGGELDDAAGVPPPAPPPPPPPQEPGSGSNGPSQTKVRSDFRETIYVNPTLITDASGRASLSIPLADSITTWRISAQGSTRDGKLGSARLNFRTFQNFFIDFDVPTTFTRGDTIALSAVVYNYLPEATDVEVTLDPADWMTVLSNSQQTVRLGPSEVRAVEFTIRAERAGAQQLSLRGVAGEVSDALVREAQVMPDGAPEDQSYSDRLNGTREHTISVPVDAIEGGTHVALTLTPGFAAEGVQGTESLLKEPYGCFEQTTSSAWPNTLVTTYLDVTGQLTPELKERSIALVTRGYQRLLTFESPTGGFNWWGDGDPGNRILSAIMLWHLKDMERVIEVDETLRERTLKWLVDQQRGDGSWASGDALHAGNEVLGTSEVRTTAFITWALAHTGWADATVEKASGYLRSNAPDGTDLYATALSANALAITDPAGQTTSALFAELDRMKIEGEEGRVKWPTSAPSWTGTRGGVADIETTGLVAYALLKGNVYPENAAGAVKFIISNKDAVGTWYNTQATMNALRALLAAASPRGWEVEGTLRVTVNGVALDPLAIAAADGDVYREIDLTPWVHAGDNRVVLEMAGTGELSYRLARRAYRPAAASAPAGPFELSVAYDKTSASIGEAIAVAVHAEYSGEGVRDQVLVRIGRGPGLSPRTDELERLVASGRIARYEINERDVTMYLMGMMPGESRDLSFHYVPTIAVVAEVPASLIRAYYQPELRAETPAIAVEVH